MGLDYGGLREGGGRKGRRCRLCLRVGRVSVENVESTVGEGASSVFFEGYLVVLVLFFLFISGFSGFILRRFTNFRE